MAGRGRPKSADAAVIAELHKQPEKLKKFQSYIENIQRYLMEQARAANAIKDIISEAAEELGLSKGGIKKIADADLNQTVESILAQASAIEEGVDLLKRHEDESPSEGSDDSF